MSSTCETPVGAGLEPVHVDLGARALTPRRLIEGIVRFLLWLCAAFAIAVTVGIVLSLVFEAMRFFGKVSVTEFLFGLEWSPQTALRPDQVGSSGAFGAVPVFLGTLLITGIAMAVAVPVGLLSAIYLARLAQEVGNRLK